MLALSCAPRGTRVHLFGFNWSQRHWARHKISAEEAHIRELHTKNLVYIHEPICGGLRTCGNCSIVADWDEEGFICSNRTYGEGDLSTSKSMIQVRKNFTSSEIDIEIMMKA
jgi:uncharacterized 2Fe-2S/4Fe-4S cluster protein (DUF4445 family)